MEQRSGLLGGTPKHQFGHRGEDIACAYLQKRGYRWLVSNYTTRMGEIDLIMEDGPALVFVEVKRRSNAQFGCPEEAVGPAKRRKLVHAAVSYVQKTGMHERLMRFDVVSIGTCGIRHYKDAFSVEIDGFYL